MQTFISKIYRQSDDIITNKTYHTVQNNNYAENARSQSMGNGDFRVIVASHFRRCYGRPNAIRVGVG